MQCPALGRGPRCVASVLIDSWDACGLRIVLGDESYLSEVSWSKVQVGQFYAKKELAEILGETTLPPVREGVFTCRKSDGYILFVNLDKATAKPEHKFNDFFNGDRFEWDSQPRQHMETKAIVDVVSGVRQVHLMARVHPKIKSKSQPFVYCGRMAFEGHDPTTTRPVHMTFKALDYRRDLAPSHPLQVVYDWTPDQAGRQSPYLAAEPGPIWERSKPTAPPEETERTAEVTQRVGQDWFRKEQLRKWGGRCVVTGCTVASILEAAHIVKWADSDEDRLNLNNGLLLSVHVHRLFDAHLLAFTNEGKMVRSRELDVTQLLALGIPVDTTIQVSPGMVPFLRQHRLKLK